MEEVFVNKVSDSGIITLNLEDYYPKAEIIVFDLKGYLFMELILKEKDFREALKNLDLSIYRDKNVALTCTTDAIIPMWAYMLVAAFLQPVAFEVFFGNRQGAIEEHIIRALHSIDLNSYQDQRIVIKGCGDLPIAEAAYIAITNKLRPTAKSIMYGEPCSTVPIYKKAIAK